MDTGIENIEVKKKVSILFMGTPEFAVPVLEGLIEKYEVRAIITQPDKKVGREGKIVSPPIKKVGDEHTILVLQPEKLSDMLEEIYALKPTLIITCAYGQIVPRELLVFPIYGCINVHASLLPLLRGGAPIHRAIMEGYKKTGVTIMHMNPYLDQGDIISQEEVEITDTDTASTLHDKLSIIGRDLLLKTLPSIIDQTAPRMEQDHSKATFATNIKKEDEKINFSKPMIQIYNQVRGLNSWPGAYTILEGKRIKVWECKMSDKHYSHLLDGKITAFYEEGIGVKVSNGEIILTVIQPEGKPKMKASDFIHGIQKKEEFLTKSFE